MTKDWLKRYIYRKNEYNQRERERERRTNEVRNKKKEIHERSKRNEGDRRTDKQM